MKSNPGTKYSLDVSGIVREPWSEVVQKIREAVCKYRNNVSVKTDGMWSKESETISKLTITVEIFDLNR